MVMKTKEKLETAIKALQEKGIVNIFLEDIDGDTYEIEVMITPGGIYQVREYYNGVNYNWDVKRYKTLDDVIEQLKTSMYSEYIDYIEVN